MYLFFINPTIVTYVTDFKMGIFYNVSMKDKRY